MIGTTKPIKLLKYTTTIDANGDATEGQIVDYHLSFKSHKSLSEIFYKKYFEPDLI